ncbi:MAG TPA: hypothetical protein VFF02_18960, partial [Anaeromyxobacteraceae bacterium]|nr:hypothetical protein [Anaeromyxobacteraceae bacterium]
MTLSTAALALSLLLGQQPAHEPAPAAAPAAEGTAPGHEPVAPAAGAEVHGQAAHGESGDHGESL